MNRRTFIAGLLGIPAAIKAAALKPVRPDGFNPIVYKRCPMSLAYWAEDLAARHKHIRVDCSPDAIDYFRQNYRPSNPNPGHAKFIHEFYPYRFTKERYLIVPYVPIHVGSPFGPVSIPNPAWQVADLEMVAVYSLTTNGRFLCLYNRRDFTVVTSGATLGDLT